MRFRFENVNAFPVRAVYRSPFNATTHRRAACHPAAAAAADAAAAAIKTPRASSAFDFFFADYWWGFAASFVVILVRGSTMVKFGDHLNDERRHVVADAPPSRVF